MSRKTNMNHAEYKRLGDYIRAVDVRNKDLKITRLMGINISKSFMPSVANVIGTDLSTYKLIFKNQFACNLMHVGRDKKIPIAMQTDDIPCIVSPAYFVFEVAEKDLLLPEYLMMWFVRSEFDRNVWFYTDADVRGGMSKETFMDMYFYLPSIDRQREIVAEYEALSHRIRQNEQMISKLEETAQTIYRQMFVDGIDKENLPKGWRMGKFTDVVKISGGGTPDTNEESYWHGDIPFFTPADSSNEYYCIVTEKRLSVMGFNNCSSKIYKKNTTFVTARGTVGELSLAGMDMAMNQSCYALLPNKIDVPFFIHQFAWDVVLSLKKEAVGAVFNALVTKDFETKDVVIPSDDRMIVYDQSVQSIYRLILIKQQENENIRKFQSLLLAKIEQ